jgi:hypothetical protein
MAAVVGWVFVAGGCCVLIWGMYSARKLENAAKRAESVKWILVGGALACLLVGVGIVQVLDIGAQLTVSQQLVEVKVVGVVMILAGVWSAWYTLRKGRHSLVERYRGAVLLPPLLKAVTATAVATGVFLVDCGLVLVTLSYPVATFTIIMGAVGVASGLVACYTSVVAAIITDRVKTDAEIERWRQGPRRG